MKVILSSAIVQMKQAIARSMFRYCLILNPFFNAILLGMMYIGKSSKEFSLYAILGSSLSSFWTIICFSSAADISREKYLGTLPILFTSPVGFKNIIFGKLLGNSIWGSVAFLLNTVFVLLLYNRSLNIEYVILLPIFIFLAILTFSSIGMLMCSAFTLSRNAQIIMNIIEYPVLLLTGTIFPVEILPEFIKPFSYLLSPTWVMEGFKLMVYGGETIAVLSVVFILLFLTSCNFFVANILFNKIEQKCKLNATLEVF